MYILDINVRFVAVAIFKWRRNETIDESCRIERVKRQLFSVIFLTHAV